MADDRASSSRMSISPSPVHPLTASRSASALASAPAPPALPSFGTLSDRLAEPSSSSSEQQRQFAVASALQRSSPLFVSSLHDHRRRNRSASEVTAGSMRSSSDRIGGERGSIVAIDRPYLPPPPSLLSSSSGGGIGPMTPLPPPSRFSSNIRRSNTISAVLHSPLHLSGTGNDGGSSPSLYGLHHLTRHRTSTSASAPHLASPHRLLSRQFPDTSRGPPFPPPISTGVSGSGGGGYFAALTSSGSSASSTTSSTAAAAAGGGLIGGGALLSPSSASSNATTSGGRRAPSRESSLMEEGEELSPRKLAKTHVPSACLNCKRAHLACDVNRPCRRCVNLGKTDTCVDVQHKKRGRPRLRDREQSTQSNPSSGTGFHEDVPTGLPSSVASGVGLGSQPHASYDAPPLPLPSSMMHRQPYAMKSSASMSSLSQFDRGFVHPPPPAPSHRSPMQDVSLDDESRNRYALFSNGAATMSGRGRSISAAAAPIWHGGRGRSPSHMHTSAAEPHAADGPASVVSMIFSTSLHCARCSVESRSVLGHDPNELMERSLFDFVHPDDGQRLERLWLGLIEPVGVRPQRLYTHPGTMLALSPAELMAPALGTVFLQEEPIRLRHRSGTFGTYSVRLHLGGGLGADLYRDRTFDRAYIVASIVRSGSHTSSSDRGDGRHFTSDDFRSRGNKDEKLDYNAHPDPNLLRHARWYDGLDPRHFVSPNTAAAALQTPATSDDDRHQAMYPIMC